MKQCPQSSALPVLFAVLVVPIGLLAGCDVEPQGVTVAAGAPARAGLGNPVDGLTREEQALFERGQAEFERVFIPENGLGPIFNANSCGECHEDPLAGGPGDEIEVHATAYRDGTCNELVEQGGPVVQQVVTPALQAALGISIEPTPAGATAIGRRTTPDLFGFGLLEAVPDASILALADPDDRDGDGISGRPNRTADGRLGRFGRKANDATLLDFNDGAFQQEQGVTDPANPAELNVGGQPLPAGVDPAPDPEVSQDVVNLVTTFVRLLAPPKEYNLNHYERLGDELFSRIGCAACHVPTMTTGADSPFPALRNITFDPYTDLLLHDMGPDLADICRGQALPQEFRTEPLMGLRLSVLFLHDGRATTIEQAVELHGGEATRARDSFLALTQDERRALVAFLRSL